MSQMTATARPLRAPRRAPAPAPLRVIPTRISSGGTGAFAATCALLLTVGLIALLLLNTALAQGSLAIGQLQKESAVLDDTAGNLREEIDRASASGALAKRAAELGMVRSNERAYISLSSGKVTGTAYPATSNQAFPVITSPTPVVTKKAASVLAAGAKVVAAATPKTPANTPGAAIASTLGSKPVPPPGHPKTPTPSR
jgi:hypothetical protein